MLLHVMFTSQFVVCDIESRLNVALVVERRSLSLVALCYAIMCWFRNNGQLRETQLELHSAPYVN